MQNGNRASWPLGPRFSYETPLGIGEEGGRVRGAPDVLIELQCVRAPPSESLREQASYTRLV